MSPVGVSAQATQGSIVEWDDFGSRRFSAPEGDDFVAVSATRGYSLALRADGTIVAWSYNAVGPFISDVPTESGFVAISAGSEHALALKADGWLVAWGDDGAATGRAFPPPGIPNGGFKAISAGPNHNLALKTDGSIVAWGKDFLGTGIAQPPTGVENTGFIAIAAGERINLAVKSDGTIVAWGDEVVHEIRDTPTDAGYVDVAVAFGENLALKDNGTVVRWGAEGLWVSQPARQYFAIAAGDYQGLGLYDTGKIHAIWTEFGPSYDNSPEADGFIAIASSATHSLAIKGVESGPSLSITGPRPGDVIAAGAPVEIFADFSVEPTGVNRVEFLVGETLLGQDAETPYSFIWNDAPAGTHQLTARAVLDDGSTILSTIVPITVARVPVIVSPAHMDTFYEDVPIDIEVRLEGLGDSPDRIEFYADSTKIGEDASEPYEFVWNNAAIGAYSLTARAIYAGDQSVRGEDAFITVVGRPRIVSPLAEEQYLPDDLVQIKVEIPGGTADVDRVEFFDGRTEIGAAFEAPFDFFWDLGAIPYVSQSVGGHALKARVIYKSGTSRVSRAVSIFVINDSFRPTIVVPTKHTTFLVNEEIPIVVLPGAHADIGDIKQMSVQYRRNGELGVYTDVGSDTESPYTFTWRFGMPDVWFLSALQSTDALRISYEVDVFVRDPKRDSLARFLKYSEGDSEPSQAQGLVRKLALRSAAAITGIDLDLLGRFRDEVLLTTPAGRYFADLYETASPALISAVLEDPSLIGSIFDAYALWAPAIQAAVDGNAASVTVTAEMANALVDMLPRVRMVGEKDLRDMLQSEVTALEPATWSGMTVSDVLTKMEGQTRPAPEIVSQSSSQSVSAASGLTLTVEAGGAGPFTYQWYRDGVAIPGATESTYSLPSAQAFHAGDYTVAVSNPFGSTESSSIPVAVNAPAPANAGLANLSTRAITQTGDGVLIPGFVVSGNGSKQLLMRVVGPTLIPFGVTNAVSNPRMTLKRSEAGGSVDVASNDDWSGAEIATAADNLGAFPLEAGSGDSALLETLSAGAYTIVAEGVDNTTGIALVEFYDADPSDQSTALANISARTFVGPGGDAPIPGFVISGDGPRTVLIRAVGPGLAAYGVAGTLPDPQFTVLAGSDPLFENNDWGSGADPVDTAATADLVGAFPLADNSKDAGMVVTLAPGSYTVVVSDATGASGIALVEVYLVP